MKKELQLQLLQCSMCKGTGSWQGHTCWLCKGTGRSPGFFPCKACNGTGGSWVEDHICELCKGTGKLLFFFKCYNCGGTGYIPKHKHQCFFCHGTGCIYQPPPKLLSNPTYRKPIPPIYQQKCPVCGGLRYLKNGTACPECNRSEWMKGFPPPGHERFP